MNYLTAKEQRVEKAWAKRGLGGLRSELLTKVRERNFFEWSDEDFVKAVCMLVFSCLPEREWDQADAYITETCGLVGVDLSGVNWSSLIYRVRLIEETLREDLGDE